MGSRSTGEPDPYLFIEDAAINRSSGSSSIKQAYSLF